MASGDTRFTGRLRLEPVGPRNSHDLLVEGSDQEPDDAPFTVCVLPRTDWDRTPR